MHDTTDRSSPLPWQAALAMLATLLLGFAFNTALQAILRPPPSEIRESVWLVSLVNFGFSAVAFTSIAALLAQASLERHRFGGYRPAWPMLLAFGGTYFVLHTIAAPAVTYLVVKAVPDHMSRSTFLPVLSAAQFVLAVLCIAAAWWIAGRSFRRHAVASTGLSPAHWRASAIFGLAFLSLQLMAQNVLVFESFTGSQFLIALSDSPRMAGMFLIAELLLWGLAALGAWFGLPASITIVRPGRLLLAAVLTFMLSIGLGVGIGLLLPDRAMTTMQFMGALGVSQVVCIPLISLGVVRLFYRNARSASPT